MQKLRGRFYDFHSKRLITGRVFKIVLISLLDSKTGYSSESKDGSYEVPMPVNQGLLRVEVNDEGNPPGKYLDDKFFIEVGDQDAYVDIEVAKGSTVNAIIEDINKDVSTKVLKVYDVFQAG